MSANGNIVPMIGRQFGLLTVLARDSACATSRSVKYLCACSCGEEKVIDGLSLRQAKTKSCGCEAGRKADREMLDTIKKLRGDVKVASAKRGKPRKAKK